jgi:hypothetical protein
MRPKISFSSFSYKLDVELDLAEVVFELDLSFLEQKPSLTSRPFLVELNIHHSTKVSVNLNIENIDIVAPKLDRGLRVQALKLAV